ncbi:CIC family chloride channel protein [Amycolatopsis echigonensis]|uniref:CIC family chloride channel protein n=1 Tax=Amycolatopsis echigonensis TaxID=2576905 RepID=A0A2N3WTK1_9PSEU|nr:chloride channel protein [Amycolatopsis niigatensis]PKV97196.1 CIC family chloride channel protein [Amycolatopsis niigatensis]
MSSGESAGKRGLVVPVRPPVGRWVRESRAGLVGLAVLIGAGAGLGAVVFRWLITTFTHVFSGHADYSDAGRAAHPWFPALGPWFLLLAPVLAGLVYGPLVYRFAPEARGHGVPEVMYAVAERGGRIPVQVSVVKALASALTIGSGGSVGREGPIVQIGSALGSSLGRLARLPESRLRILVACGAAGGIAATFNAPLAGPFFAMELILRDFAAESFGAVVLASVTASVVGRAVFGNTPFLNLPPFSLRSPVEYLLFVALGLVVGACGVLFTRVLYWIEDLCDRLWRGPEWLRPAVGGVFLGGLLLLLPQMYGVGYPVLQNAVEGKYVFGFLLVLMLGKIVATSLTIGIGGSGGVFAPSLFIGAMAGTAFGIGVHAWLPSVTASPGVYGLIGMGAAFAGSARAPITAVIVLFELTGQYTVILPMLTAIVIATAISRALSRDTIYTLKLRRRGIDLDKHPSARRLADTKVSAVTEPLPEPLRDDLPLEPAAHALALSGHGILPVVDDEGRYQGCATARAVAEAVADDHEGRVGDLAELPPLVTADSTLADALDALAQAPGTGLPVLTGKDELTGWITHQSVLSALEPAAAGR